MKSNARHAVTICRWITIALTSAIAGFACADSENIALKKTAVQFTTALGASASLATDGNTSGVWADGSVTHTKDGVNRYWMVDLGSDHVVSEVKIWNRTDCCQDRLDKFNVFLTKTSKAFDPADLYSTETFSFVGKTEPSMTILGAKRGRYLWIVLHKGPLSLAEVQVKGSPVYTETQFENRDMTGTAHVDGDIIKPEDPTAFKSLAPFTPFAGKNKIYDRRVGKAVMHEYYAYDATMNDGTKIGVLVVSTDYKDKTKAEAQAKKYAKMIGQLPATLRAEIDRIDIMKGDNDWGGINGEMLIHTGRTATYEQTNTAEEVLFHEAVHAGLDGEIKPDASWKAAQKEDNRYISTYAKTNADREDVAESFLPYYALRQRGDRIGDEYRQRILNVMPARIRFFDAKGLNLKTE